MKTKVSRGKHGEHDDGGKLNSQQISVNSFSDSINCVIYLKQFHGIQNV